MSEMFYDAFISYRHTELDSYIAKKLHGMLEHYRIPKKIQEISGKKKITRIFRDQEELPLSADLSANIKAALEKSEFLIVICSPEALESRWVKAEIEIFLESHSRDRVLTILVRGEPEEAFPEILCYQEQVVVEGGIEKTIQVPVEPLAADVRAATKEEAGKKLKKEILRILAPMLSCRFDDLRQRQKEYRTKWIICILAAIMSLTVGFGIYSARQAAAIEEQYQASLRNQARYLCNVSGQLLNSGDRIGALQTALAIQTEDGKEALVPEQIYALNNALYSYQNENSIYQKVDCELEIEHPVMKNYLIDARNSGYVAEFSPKGTYLFVLDQIGTAYIFDSISGDCVYQCKAADFSEIATENFQEGTSISEKEVILFTDQSIITLNIETQQCTKWEMEDATALVSLNYKIQDQRIVFSTYSGFYVFDYGTQEKLLESQRYVFGDKENDERVIIEEGELVDVALSPTAQQLAAVFAPGYGEEQTSYVMKVYSLDTGECRSWEIENFDEENSIMFVDEEHIASLWIAEVEDEYIMESYRPYSYGVYEIASGELLWRQDIYGTIADYTKGTLMVEDMDRAGEKDDILETMLITVMGNQMQVTTAQTGEVIANAVTNHRIVGMNILDSTRMFVGAENGDVYIATTTSKGELTKTTSCENTIVGYLYTKGSETSAIIGQNGQSILFYRTAKDHHMNEINGKVSTVYYDVGAEGNYCIFVINATNENPTQRALVRDLKTDEIVAEIVAKEAHHAMEDFAIFSKDSQEYVLYTVKSGDYDINEPQTLIFRNLQTGTVIWQKTLENTPGNEDNKRYDEFDLMAADGETTHVVLYNSSNNYFKIVDYATGETVIPFQTTEKLGEYDHVYIDKVGLSEDGKYFIFAGRSRVYEDGSDIKKCGWFVKLWDIAQQQWVAYGQDESCYLEVPLELEYEFSSSNYIVGTKAMQAAVYMEEKEIYIVDLMSGEVTHKIPFSGKNSCKMAFFDSDQYLLLLGDDGHLMMWSFAEEKIVMKDVEQLTSVGSIYVDESNRYFGITSSNSLFHSTCNIYYVDENHQFYHYANIADGFASFQYEEIFSFGYQNFSYYTKFYDYETLKTRAEEILQGKEMTEEELRMYYILKK